MNDDYDYDECGRLVFFSLRLSSSSSSPATAAAVFSFFFFFYFVVVVLFLDMFVCNKLIWIEWIFLLFHSVRALNRLCVHIVWLLLAFVVIFSSYGGCIHSFVHMMWHLHSFRGDVCSGNIFRFSFFFASISIAPRIGKIEKKKRLKIEKCGTQMSIITFVLRLLNTC